MKFHIINVYISFYIGHKIGGNDKPKIKGFELAVGKF